MNPKVKRVPAAGGLVLMTGLLAMAGCEVPPEAGAQAAPAQQETMTPLPPEVINGDTIQLVFEREVFTYPGFQRRNPFAPLTGQTDGPRYEDLELRMVILVEDGPGSVATLALRGTGGGQQARTFRVREGDVLGNMRVRTIRLREILVDVDEFGQRETRVMELRRQEPEAVGGDAPPDAPPPDTTGAGGDMAPPDVIIPDTTLMLSGTGNGGSE